MSRALPALLASLALPAAAEAPRVAADIAPVHSLVARVMEGVGEPALVVPPGASPHEHSLRPSEAAALQEADLVFWIGEDLTPWLGDAVGTLAGDAAVTSLLSVEGTVLLEVREDALFEAHDHAHDHEGEEEGHGHGHEAHSGEAGHDHDHDDHAEEAGHDDHGHDDHAGEDDHAHDHSAHDPHAWLSPDNAALWMNAIAAALSAADPDNAGAYFANAAAGRAELAALEDEVAALLDPVRDGRFLVFHDAYQYFETAFDIPAAGAISLSDATDPSPARIAEIRDRLRADAVDCVLAEPQFNASLVETVTGGTDAATAVLDPLGSALEPGPALYPALIRDLARSLAGCL